MNSISRRNFIGTAAGVMGASSLAPLGAIAQAAAEATDAATNSAVEPAGQPVNASAPSAPKFEDIRVGMLTAPMGDMPFDYVLDMAQRCGIGSLEVIAAPGHSHLDPMTFGAAEADALKQKLAQRGLEISALSNYMNTTEPGKTAEVQEVLKKTIDAAALLGVPTICTLVGMPQEGTSRIYTIKRVVPGVFRPVLDHAAEKGINVAVENWFATCLQGLDTFDCLMETIPDAHFGLNFDPSHLLHQQCDYRVPVARFAKRIFHTHAKDCLVDEPKRAYVGVLGADWWRYVIPGLGGVRWGEYIGLLRQAGYKGVLSIEHEDNTFGLEEGFRQGARYLGQFCAG